VRFIEIHRKRVVMRRSLAGMRMAISLPVSCFLGVALRIIPPDSASEGAVAIVLEHRDAALAIPLFAAPDGKEAVAEWRAWGRVLGLPLLVADADVAAAAARSNDASRGFLHGAGRRACHRRRASIVTNGKSSRAVRTFSGEVGTGSPQKMRPLKDNQSGLRFDWNGIRYAAF
jgi:hypothetical protein